MSQSAGRHIVAVSSGREVAFRRLGSGPPVALLHESPRSSVALLPLAERLADRFTVFAFDTPGFGLSDPLPHRRADAAEFADALAEGFDAIGLGRVPLYGAHTGAVIAMEFACRYPERVACTAFEGYPVFTPAEQAELLASYLAPIVPDWEGSYLAWLWARVRDQFVFFPWYSRGQGARLRRAPPPLAFHQQVVCDLLAAGDHYRIAYAAAFRYDPVPPVSAAKMPISYLARPEDMLFPHLDRLPRLGAKDEIVHLSNDRDEWAKRIAAALGRVPGDATPPATRDAFPRAPPGRIERRFWRGEASTLLARRTGAGGKTPMVLLTAAPGAGRALEPTMRALGRSRAVYAFDLPGQGGATECPPDASCDTLGGEVAAAVTRLVDGPVAIAGCEGAATIAAAAARRLGDRARLCVAIDPAPEDEPARKQIADHVVDITPHRAGGHILAAWHLLAESEIWKPWFEQRPDRARPLPADLDVLALDAAITEWMRGGPSYRHMARAALRPAPCSALGAVSRRAVIAFEGDPDLPAARDLAAKAKAHFAAAPRNPDAIAAALVRLTDAA